ncbi:hypothetical protein TL16_g05418 [Triparma laevis f. inornata]|uniref:Uncharacterized protein n=1 Tax=Triparma laevis f. inornata TaxID=1714386 RepID=A0A9W7AH48_9STRA|nr:hypothetical protein TL16_g05418 [Triparma laevis f. inornata]
MVEDEVQQTHEIRELATELRATGFAYSVSNNRFSKDETQPGHIGGGEGPITTITKMPFWVKCTFGAPQFSIFSIYMLISVHATLYYEKMGAKLAYLAFFTAFARSFDVLTDPLMSWWSDSTRTKWGRRRPFIAVGCFFFAFNQLMLLSPGVIAPSLKGTNGVSYWYGAFFVLFYLSDTLCNVPYNAFGPELTEDTAERSNMYFVQNIFGMVGTLMGAACPPGIEASGISMEWSFTIVGLIFGGWFIVTQLWLVHSLRERAESQKQAPVPLVTSMNRALRNDPFSRILLASFLDSVGWFALAATMPFYLQYVVRPGAYSDTSDEVWLAIGLVMFFISAIIATPFWLWCCKRFGKFRTWLAFNAMNGLTNSFFLFIPEGGIIASMIVTCLNGAPLGARFLNDSTLADTIDYDEFMSGERREAQFTMFISFVPKVVSIPTQALPIALIAAAGFIKSVDEDGDGKVEPQDQPDAVKAVIKWIYIGLPVCMNIFSFYVKWHYPITSEEMNRKISEGITLHAAGLPAQDPITGKMIPCKGNLTEKEIDDGNLLDHFALNDLKKLCKSADTSFLLQALYMRRAIGGFLLVGCLGGVYASFGWLEDPTLSFIPSMFQIGIGLAMMYLVIVTFRVQAAYELNKQGIDVEFVRKWRAHIGDTPKKSSAPLPLKLGIILKRLRERMAKVAPALARKSGGERGL